MSGIVAALADSVRTSLERLVGGPPHEAGPFVVAASGGLDSGVLTHLLRFRMEPRPTVVLAHFDHAMRPESADDALWLRGVAEAWGVELVGARASEAPASEDAARTARYAFLERVAAEAGARWIVTAHHADDQAETVLFRALRGTGVEGLRGMDAARAIGTGGVRLLRPLLDVWREDLEAYAAEAGLRWREDPTNAGGGYARNVIRHDLLPIAEERVAPGARRALVRLAGLARDEDDAWAEVLPRLLGELGWDGRGVDAARAAALGPALRGRVLRHLAREQGVVLDHRTTARAVDFTAHAGSGHGIELGGGVELRRELGRLLLVEADVPEADEPLVIPDAGPGRGTARLGGRRLLVRWAPREAGPGAGPGLDASVAIVLPLPEVTFPLVVRGRRPGDRIDVWGGTRRVKRLLQDARVPSLERPSVPIVVDAAERVLWIPGVAEWSGAASLEAASGEDASAGASGALFITVEEE